MVVAREDGRLGPRLHASDVNGVGDHPPPGRDFRGRHPGIPWHHPDLLEGTLTMAERARWLPEFVGRPVVDRTGLSGSYAVTVRLTRRRPALDSIRDDLGLQFVPSRLVRQTVIVERFGPPSGV